MPFEAFDVSLEMVRSLGSHIVRLRSQDPDLATQVRKAAASVPLNLSEGRRRVGRDRKHHWRVAAGSADEVRASLLVAEAWGYIEMEQLGETLGLLDRVLAMCWRLTH